MIAPRSFRWEIDGDGVGTLTLARPERLNALTFEVYGELRDLFQALPGMRRVRAVILTGEGPAFCTGGDVDEIIGPLLERDIEGLYQFTRMTCDVILGIRRCPQPVVAAINGTTAGAGAVIAAACDLRVASEAARIAFLFTRVGLSGADMGAAWLLPRLVGHGRATELLMLGGFVSANDAQRIGLFDLVVPDGEVATAAAELAHRLASGPAEALAVTKRALDDEWAMGLEEALEHEARVQAERMLDPDFGDAYAAWREKRSPRFR